MGLVFFELYSWGTSEGAHSPPKRLFEAPFCRVCDCILSIFWEFTSQNLKRFSAQGTLQDEGVDCSFVGELCRSRTSAPLPVFRALQYVPASPSAREAPNIVPLDAKAGLPESYRQNSSTAQLIKACIEALCQVSAASFSQGSTPHYMSFLAVWIVLPSRLDRSF